MSDFWDILGTSLNRFKFGFQGAQVKAKGTGLEVKNSADTASAFLEALLFATVGDDFELNSDAANTGADFKFTIRRPSTGMTQAITLVMPAGTPTTGQAITVASVAAGVITLAYTTIAAGTDKAVNDKTALAFGTPSPLTMLTLPANAEVQEVFVIIRTQFDGNPTLSVGIAGTVSKYAPTNAFDLLQPPSTRMSWSANNASVGTAENIIATYSAGGSTVGAADIYLVHVQPI